MPENLVEKTLTVKLETAVPVQVYDDQGKLIGSAYIDGFVGVTVVVDKHHPAALDLETDNGLAKLKLDAKVDNNIITGTLTIGG